MIYVLLGLVAGLAWALWFIMQWGAWFPLCVTAMVGAAAVVVLMTRALRGRRSARGLEKALAEQGKQQEMNARPERRLEIQALRQQMLAGIEALRSSAIRGKARGGDALYALPWYAIIGPPGAGKTTALRHSGLEFPYGDSALKGVGGTRHCDWWFTRDAILLDTAGRYATGEDDREEWLAFLDMLRTHRVEKPLNGVIVAVSVADIVDATDAELDAMGTKLRARIDEVMTRLSMVLPVYFLVTKCDLIGGFVEFFGHFRKSQRIQCWGATIPVKEDKRDPGAVFAREFDVMIREVHARACKRIGVEPNRGARESVFQFPIELAGLRRNVHELVARVFAPNPFQATPMFRGFYFTSGTQEGLPLSRVLSRMGQAMGIAARPAAAQLRTEPRSYFLHDVFTRVVFADAELASQSASERRRQRLVRAAIAAVAVGIACTFAIPAVHSYSNNRQLIDDTSRRVSAVSGVDWADGAPIGDKLDRLDPILERLKELDDYEDHGPPWGYKFLMYSGDEVHGPLLDVYRANMQKAFVEPVANELEGRVRRIEGKPYYADRELLKTYLMLSEVAHLDVDWATGKYTLLWAEALKSTSNLGLSVLKKRLRPHVRYYLELASARRIAPVEANDDVVQSARKKLAAVPVRERYWSLFIDSLNYELYDPAEGRVNGNLQFPPITLAAIFSDRPEVLELIGSKRFKETTRYFSVEGPYTDKGHFAVLANIEKSQDVLESEQWVVPLDAEERGERIAENVKRVADDYESSYIKAWVGFFEDSEVARPASVGEAVSLYDALQKQEWPYLRLLRTLEDHTQWPKTMTEVLENDAATRILNQKVNSALSRRMHGLRLGLDVRKIAGRTSTIPGAFVQTVGFGVAEKNGPPDTHLGMYMDLLGALRSKMLAAPGANANVFALELQKSSAQCTALLSGRDSTATRLLEPLLQRPLQVGN